VSQTRRRVPAGPRDPPADRPPRADTLRRVEGAPDGHGEVVAHAYGKDRRVKGWEAMTAPPEAPARAPRLRRSDDASQLAEG
jgi:hypothetical protein